MPNVHKNVWIAQKKKEYVERRRKEEGLVDSGHPPHALKSRNSSLMRPVWEHENWKNYHLNYLYGPMFYVYSKLSNRLKY